MNKKILHFEDDEMLRQMFGIKLVNSGFEYSGYEHPPKEPQELVELVLKERPDFILMNLIMPVMDGFQATKILKSDPRTLHIPIVAHTNMSQVENVEQFITECKGDDYYIYTHYVPSELLDLITTYLTHPEKYQVQWKKLIK